MLKCTKIMNTHPHSAHGFSFGSKMAAESFARVVHAIDTSKVEPAAERERIKVVAALALHGRVAAPKGGS
jgi:hypothetical protein